MILVKDYHFVFPDDSLRKAIHNIDKGAIGIVVVLDPTSHILIGTVTDGDIRRSLLRGCSLDSFVSEAMNINCVKASLGATEATLREIAKHYGICQIPLVDDLGRVRAIKRIDEIASSALASDILLNEVVIMAGGLGQRLMPLTENTPKPMLNVGDRPILETMIRNFSNLGFKNFTIAVNYLSHKIVDHFKDGSAFGVKIKYIQEDKKLGTAGALSLLEEKPTLPFFVVNGDLLTKVNFKNLLDFHKQVGAMATISVKQYGLEVPYGVVKVDGNRVQSIEEKPTYNFFINAGIYILSPEILDYVKKDQYLDMPTVLSDLTAQGERISSFPIWEHWLDVGHREDYLRAHDAFFQFYS